MGFDFAQPERLLGNEALLSVSAAPGHSLGAAVIRRMSHENPRNLPLRGCP